MVNIQRVQLWRKYILAAGLAVMLAWTATVRAVPYLEHPVEHLGLVCILACILGRAWCSLYIGGRKKQEIVDVGPYSISRNPLYVFSFLGAFGVGAQTGSLVVAVVFAAAAYVVFRVVVGREEAFLLQAFGSPYEAYLSRTPFPAESVALAGRRRAFHPARLLLANGSGRSGLSTRRSGVRVPRAAATRRRLHLPVSTSLTEAWR